MGTNGRERQEEFQQIPLLQLFLEKVKNLDDEQSEKLLEQVLVWGSFAVGPGSTVWKTLETRIRDLVETHRRQGNLEIQNPRDLLNYAFAPDEDGTVTAKRIMRRLEIDVVDVG